MSGQSMTKARRQLRRERAQQRQDNYNSLPLDQKIVRAGAKQLKKLLAKTEKKEESDGP